MYITEVISQSKTGKTYRSILLRESYRENGKVKNRTLANLTKSKPQDIAAIKLALEHKDDLTVLTSLCDSVQLQEGPSIGAAWTVYQTAKRLGLQEALGTSFQGKLALWQVMARVIEQGSRLSAARLARIHAACDILQMQRGFDENDLYDNLKWLAGHQEKIEQRLILSRRGGKKTELFFYDVTSSYLEGENNQLAAYGYNRDKKQGKQQLVIGLLCDESGEPASIDVFPGDTSDPNTVSFQIRKVTQRFDCHRVTFVGDRGMIKKKQIQALSEMEFYYITAITKPQIRTLMNSGIIKMDKFDEKVYEISHEGIRYILRRNSNRVQEIAITRQQKRQSIEQLIQKENRYLGEHPRALVSKALERLNTRIGRLKVHPWLSVMAEDRTLFLKREYAELSISLGKVIKVTRSFMPGLFAYYRCPGLPVTNNDLEIFHRKVKTAHRRRTGRKSSHDYIIRYGKFAVYQIGTDCRDRIKSLAYSKLKALKG